MDIFLKKIKENCEEPIFISTSSQKHQKPSLFKLFSFLLPFEDS